MTDKAMSVEERAEQLSFKVKGLGELQRIHLEADIEIALLAAVAQAREETFEQTKRVCAKQFDDYQGDRIWKPGQISERIRALPLSALDKEKSA